MLALLIALLCFTISSADAATVTFSGTAQACASTASCNRFGLGVENNTPFTGTFSFDPGSGEGLGLTVEFPNRTLTVRPQDLILIPPTADDPFVFNLRAPVLTEFGGVFLNINLRASVAQPLGTPSALSCADWVVCSLVVWPYDGIPGEPPFTPAITAINLGNTMPEAFQLNTVGFAPISGEPQALALVANPEPATLWLVGGAAMLGLAWQKRDQ